MVFSGLPFLFLYLVVTLGVYYVVPRKFRNIWLFIVNLVFYGWGEPVYIVLMLFSIALNYGAGLLITRTQTHKKRYLTLCIVLNLAMLFFFKYYDFLAGTLRSLGVSFLRPVGLELPIGISFYTFQSMAYPIDIYRGKIQVQRSFVRFGTFVALFPQLIAGPIVRYQDIAERLECRQESVAQFASGVRRFVLGLGKKVLFANNIGALWAVYSGMDCASLSVADAWLGAISFTLQIYFDFSGYSDMAVGLGRMLGFDFPENFRYPYISDSLTEFWRRWHITLSSWFRDYVYIPLGGNRCAKSRRCLNLLIVWTLTGLWHGASFNYLLWGVYYAVLLILEKTVLRKALSRLPKVLRRVYALLFIIIGWVIFSLESLPHCFAYLAAMFGGGSGLRSDVFLYYLRSYFPVLALMCLASTPLLRKAYERLNPAVRLAVTPVFLLAVLVLSTAYLVNSSYNPFLYFRF